MGRKSAAMDAYEKALREDPRFADCHYNLALLCKSLGRPKQALKHMAQYRRLVKP
jgi:tetratricopeptide (TPR) repeat protein